MKGLKTTFILGSGATRGAIKGFNHNGRRILPPMNGDFLGVARAFTQSYREKILQDRLTRLLTFIYDEIGVSKNESPTMEEIFSMLYTSKDFPEVYKKQRGRTPLKFIQIDDFLFLIVRIFNEIEKNMEGHNVYNLYDKLVPSLENKDTLITLNYDTLLDNALMNHDWDPRKGYGLSTTNYEGFDNFKKSQNTHKINLYKLHGSFNWFTRKKGNDLSVLFKNKPSCISNPQKKRWKEKSGLIRQIIPPIYGKFFSHSFWQKLWTKAFESLISCDDLVVIGCSLIQTDFHLRSLLGRVKIMRKIKNNPFKTVTIVDPNPETYKKFKSALRGCKSKIVLMKTFEQFIQNATK